MANPNSSSRVPQTTADMIFDAVYSGAVGGASVAILFVIIDALQGHPLFTPSLMGSVLLGGEPASAVTTVRLDMVAYFSALHFAAFGVLGASASVLLHRVEQRSHPALVVAGLFAAMQVLFFAAEAILMPGVVTQVGLFSIALANVVAAGSMSLFLLSHRPVVWRQMKHAMHLAN